MKKLLSAFALLLLSTSPSVAQDVSEDPQIAEFIDFVNSTVNGIVNASTLFTSQDAVSSGFVRLNFPEGSGNDGDPKIDILKVPFKFSFCDEQDAKVRPYIRGVLGRAKQSEEILSIEGATGPNDTSTVTTSSATLGGGVDFEIFDNFTLSPDFTASYSRISNKYKYNNDVSQFLSTIIDGQVFNWDLDVMTYAPSIKAQYVIPLESLTITLASRFAHLINRSFDSTSDIIDVDSTTNIFRNGAAVEIPTGATLLDTPIALRPHISRNDLGGAAKSALGVSYFYESGLDLAFKVKEQLPIISEFSVGAAYTWGDDIEGFRIGVSAMF
jgi:hypothetical protein